MIVAHLTSSGFYGGPERQMLGLALGLPDRFRTTFLLFAERGASRAFADQIREHGQEVVTLDHNMPRLRAATLELAGLLPRLGIDVLCCHGYKADLLGRPAARRAGVPVLSVSRGWTAETPRVRVYEALDRFCLRWMDRVVCVSEGQAAKVRRAGVPAGRVAVIRNAIRTERFESPDPADLERLRALFPEAPDRIVGAAGRLSPEKGFGVLVEAAARVFREDPGAGFVHFGDGRLREALEGRIEELGLRGRFVLAGFRSDVDRFLPHLDLVVLPSYTEGLPNVALEALAAGVAVVATAVGGTPEVVEDGLSGYLVPPGDPEALAGRILDALRLGPERRAMGLRGRDRVRAEFTFEAQAARYAGLFDELTAGRLGRRADPARSGAEAGPDGEAPRPLPPA